MQFPGKEDGLGVKQLGDEISVVRRALDQAGVVALLEIMTHVNVRGYNALGYNIWKFLRQICL